MPGTITSLKGGVIALYQDGLELDSDKLGLRNLKWKDVKKLLPAGTMEVSFVDGEVVTGEIRIDEDWIRFLGAQERQLPR